MAIEEQIKALMEENEALRRQVSEKDATISSQKDEIAKLLDTLAYLRKKQFGQMSEKRLPLIPHSSPCSIRRR